MNKEDTFRALKNEPLLQKFRCRCKWHKWTNWTDLERPNSNQGIYPEQQKRHCIICNKHEVLIMGN